MTKAETTHTITIPLPKSSESRGAAGSRKPATSTGKKSSHRTRVAGSEAPSAPGSVPLVLVNVPIEQLDGITIDEEFRTSVPAIGDDERKQLEESILTAGGVRDPLTIWMRGEDRVLLDGHNRLEICKRHRLPCACHYVEFASRDDAADWIDRNQLGRRNLTKESYTMLLGRRYNRLKNKPGAQKGNNNAAENKPEKVTTSNTAQRLADEHGVTEKTVRNAGKFQAAAETLGMEQEISSGRVKASESVVVEAAARLPANPTADDVKRERDAVKASPKKRRTTKGKGKAEKAAPKTTTAKPKPNDNLRAAVSERWEKMKVWGKHWGIADMKTVRALFINVICDEQKQYDK